MRWPAIEKHILMTWFLVCLGLALRLYHFGRAPSLWHDEAAVIVNVLDKSYGELLGPLRFANPSPPLFLWIEKAVEENFGDTVYMWRVFPFLASCGALILMVPVARHVLPLQAVPWAILLFACSDRLLWHCCEAKPYSVDVFCAVALLAGYCYMDTWSLRRQLLVYLAATPVLIFLSYPGAFLCGGILVALLPAAWKDKRFGTWLAYGAFGLTVAVCFGTLVLGPIRAQRCGELMSYWLRQFPNWQAPWSVPGWTIGSIFEMFRYCYKPTGGMLILVTAVGAVHLWRVGRKELVSFLIVPMAAALGAAFLKYYPFGHSRTEMYAAPGAVLLTAAGVPVFYRWLRDRARLATILLLLLLLAPLGLTLYRVMVPWDRPDSAGASAYVLAHRETDDPVDGSHWEHEYFFRGLGPLFHLGVDGAVGNQNRLWVVSEGATRDVRMAPILLCMPPGWSIDQECEDFAFVTVALVSRHKTPLVENHASEGSLASPPRHNQG